MAPNSYYLDNLSKCHRNHFTMAVPFTQMLRNPTKVKECMRPLEAQFAKATPST